jgi:hypothetical protein
MGAYTDDIIPRACEMVGAKAIMLSSFTGCWAAMMFSRFWASPGLLGLVAWCSTPAGHYIAVRSEVDGYRVVDSLACSASSVVERDPAALLATLEKLFVKQAWCIIHSPLPTTVECYSPVLELVHHKALVEAQALERFVASSWRSETSVDIAAPGMSRRPQ